MSLLQSSSAGIAKPAGPKLIIEFPHSRPCSSHLGAQWYGITLALCVSSWPGGGRGAPGEAQRDCCGWPLLQNTCLSNGPTALACTVRTGWTAGVGRHRDRHALPLALCSIQCVPAASPALPGGPPPDGASCLLPPNQHRCLAWADPLAHPQPPPGQGGTPWPILVHETCKSGTHVSHSKVVMDGRISEGRHIAAYPGAWFEESNALD